MRPSMVAGASNRSASGVEMKPEEAKTRFAAAWEEERELQDLLSRARAAESDYYRAGEFDLRDKAERDVLHIEHVLQDTTHRRKALWWIAYATEDMPGWEHRPLLRRDTFILRVAAQEGA